jgi:hypothetical protein
MATIYFICGAFAAYTLLYRWVAGKNRMFQPKRGPRSGRRLLVAGGGLALGIFVLLSVWPAEKSPQPHLGRFLGTVGANDVIVTSVTFDDFVQPLTRIPNEQPLYAYLHPESPAYQLATAREPRQGRPSRPGSPQKYSKDIK